MFSIRGKRWKMLVVLDDSRESNYLEATRVQISELCNKLE